MRIWSGMRVGSALLVLTLCGVGHLDAQRRRPGARMRAVEPPAVELGIRGGYDFAIEGPAVGIQVRLPLAPYADLVPSGDYCFATGQTAWQANLDLIVDNALLPLLFIGVGGALAHRAFEVGEIRTPEATRLGLNILAGVSAAPLLRSRFRPYVEVRWTAVPDFDSHVALVGGVNLRLGGRR